MYKHRGNSDDGEGWPFSGDCVTKDGGVWGDGDGTYGYSGDGGHGVSISDFK